MGSLQNWPKTDFRSAQPAGDAPVRQEYRAPCASTGLIFNGGTMAHLMYEKEITGLVVIDPYNDFISEGGKLWNRIKGVAETNQCIPHMKQVLEAARKAGIRIFYFMHHRYRAGDYETWTYIAPIQKAAWSRKTFEYGTWGGE